MLSCRRLSTSRHRRLRPRRGVDGSNSRTSGRLVVLSAGGAFIELDYGYPVGRPLGLQFEVGDLDTIGCRAIVRRHLEDRGVGVEFLNIDPADRDLLTTFVKQHESRSP